MRPIDRKRPATHGANVRGSMSGMHPMSAAPVVPTMAVATTTRPETENSVTFIEVKLIQGAYTTLQKPEIVERLTNTMVEIEGENLRRFIWCVIEEVAGGQWSFGGQTPTADDVRALARGEVAAG